MAAATILSGVRVLDMTSVMFGPYCTETLANLGAEIIKLETPAGDELRRVGRPKVNRRMGPAHLTMNRGKMSIAWDIKTAEGRRDLHDLLATCDILIHNLRAEAAVRAGLDYAGVTSVRPDIVYVHCTGFASDGPYAGLPAYDDVIQALSGAASLTPRVTGDGVPRFLPTAIADKVSGLHAAYAVLAALYHRERTGEGQAIEVPMFEATTHFLLQEHLYGHTFAPPNGPAGYPRQLDADRQPMRTLDGHVVIAPYTDARWLRFFAVVGREDVLADAALETPLLRLKNVAILQRAMAAIVATRSSAEWLHLMAEHDIPASNVNDLEAVLDDVHLKATGFFEQLEHPSEGPYIGMKPPVRFGAGEGKALHHAPMIGGDDATVRALMSESMSRTSKSKR